MEPKLASNLSQNGRVEIVVDLPIVIGTTEFHNVKESNSSSSSISNSTSTTSSTTCSKEEHSFQSHNYMMRIISNCDVGYFRISLSLCAQASLWKSLVHYTQQNHQHIHNNIDHDQDHLHNNIVAHYLLMRHLPSTALLLLWSLALTTLVATSLVYLLKCFFHLSKVKQEFFHHVAANYFFAPWTSGLLLLHASPFTTINKYGRLIMISCLLALVVPIIVLNIKIYGQWFTRGKRHLSRVANPASQLSVIANLVAARASVDVIGWKEVGLCFFSLGMAHYLVLFVTLYQRLPGGDGFPMTLRPVFFLFIATPSMASLAWGSISGGFDNAAKMLFCLSLFLFLSLACRPRLFKKAMDKFSVAWWSYCFSLTLLALASIDYAKELKTGPAHAIMLSLSAISISVLFVLLIFTVINANTLLMLFPKNSTTTTTHISSQSPPASITAQSCSRQSNSTPPTHYAIQLAN